MKLLSIIPLSIIYLILSGYQTPSETSKTLNAKPVVIPAIQEWVPDRGYFTLTGKSTITAKGGSIDAGLILAEGIQVITGINIEVQLMRTNDADNIVLLLDSMDTSIANEGYTIEIDDQINIKARNVAGLFYGAQTILQILSQDSSNLSIPKGYISDFPLIQERAYMMDIGRKYFSMDYLKKTIRNMAWYKLNVFHMHFTDWSGFRLKSDKYPELASIQAYSKQDIRELQDYAKKYNIMIVPEIDLPAHATAILRYDPSLGFECESMLTARWLPDSVNETKDGWMLNITNPEVRTFIKELLDEFIPLFDAPYFHIGGDEWQYDFQKEACDELMEYTKLRGFQYPGDVYVEWINEVNKQVKSYGKTTQIWNWWRFSPKPEWQNITSLQPDKDIIINVWNQSRQGDILADGYRAIITPEVGLNALYVTPGSDGKKPGDYGYFDCEGIYERWIPVVDDQIVGYKICLWSDKVESQEDDWFDQFTDNPKAIFAEITWGKKSSSSLEEFLSRKNLIGLNPITN